MKVCQFLGAGSHGWVFEAEVVASGERVALKVLPHPDGSVSLRAKTGFRRMSKLRHRGLMRLRRIHPGDEYIGLSMERIDGQDLASLVTRWRALPLAEACGRVLEMIRQVSAAVGWMHARQLIHRDIKPSNLMWCPDDDRFVLVDYDLVGEYDPGLDPSGIRRYLVWTPRYVAPEVLFRQQYGPASDIFSLGMVVLEALRAISSTERVRERAHRVNLSSHSDEKPMVAPESPSAILDHEIRRDEADVLKDQALIQSALGGLHPDLPGELVAALSEMLAPDAADRPMAMSLTRLGLVDSPTTTSFNATTELDRVRRCVLVSRRAELDVIARWAHLIMGGQIQRLHIEGPSGIGKSTLLDVALETLARQPWIQVFTARCERREQRPLQAFSQITDGMVARFRRGDRDPLVVDLVTESILRRAIPGLAAVVRGDPSLPGLITSPSRPGGLEAAQRICEQLRQLGPLVFVIDDSHLADQDTCNVLDHLQSTSQRQTGTTALEGLGIITVSRSGGDRQRVAANERLLIEPLSDERVSEILCEHAGQFGWELTGAQRQQLLAEIEGLPYRLDALLNEWYRLSQRGESSAATRLRIMQGGWQYPLDQLNPGPRQWMEMIAVCGRPLNIDELIQCAGAEDRSAAIESDLDELIHQGLIQRDGSQGQMLRVRHDRLRQQVFASLTQARLCEWHLRWASYLQNTPGVAAAEVAVHFDQTNLTEEFLVWAERAAEQATHLFAHAEAGRWYRAVADRTEGERRREALRAAAETFQRAGRLNEAAWTYGDLAEASSGDDRLTAELNQVLCLMRSGRLNELARFWPTICHRLGLPGLKPRWLTLLSVLARGLAWQFLREDLSEFQRDPQRQRSIRVGHQISACLRLTRPLSMIDNLRAAELSLFASFRVRRYGSLAERVETAVGEAVFRAYNAGSSRRRGQQILDRLQEQLRDFDAPAMAGDIHAGQSWVALLSGRSADCLSAMETAERFYNLTEESKSFELAHLKYAQWIAYLETGQLRRLAEGVDELATEASTSNDQFQFLLSTLGHAAAGHLVGDQVETLETAHQRLATKLGPVGMQAFAMMESVKEGLLTLYRRDVTKSQRVAETLRRTLKENSLHRVQRLRVVVAQLQVTLALQLLADAPASAIPVLKGALRELRRENLPLASLIADVAESIAHRRYSELFSFDVRSERMRAQRLLAGAAEQAAKLQLVPYVLMIKDEQEHFSNQSRATHLIEHLQMEGVRQPVWFARLYRGVDDRPTRLVSEMSTQLPGS